MQSSATTSSNDSPTLPFSGKPSTTAPVPASNLFLSSTSNFNLNSTSNSMPSIRHSNPNTNLIPSIPSTSALTSMIPSSSASSSSSSSSLTSCSSPPSRSMFLQGQKYHPYSNSFASSIINTSTNYPPSSSLPSPPFSTPSFGFGRGMTTLFSPSHSFSNSSNGLLSFSSSSDACVPSTSLEPSFSSPKATSSTPLSSLLNTSSFHPPPFSPNSNHTDPSVPSFSSPVLSSTSPSTSANTSPASSPGKLNQKQRKSFVWQYFHFIDNEAICIVPLSPSNPQPCLRRFKYSYRTGCSTGNLIRHLFLNHHIGPPSPSLSLNPPPRLSSSIPRTSSATRKFRKLTTSKSILSSASNPTSTSIATPVVPSPTPSLQSLPPSTSTSNSTSNSSSTSTTSVALATASTFSSSKTPSSTSPIATTAAHSAFSLGAPISESPIPLPSDFVSSSNLTEPCPLVTQETFQLYLSRLISENVLTLESVRSPLFKRFLIFLNPDVSLFDYQPSKQDLFFAEFQTNNPSVHFSGF